MVASETRMFHGLLAVNDLEQRTASALTAQSYKKRVAI
jgi:hypothetical protein